MESKLKPSALRRAIIFGKFAGDGWGAVHLATLLFGVSGLFGKWLTLPPMMIVLGRVMFATFALGLFIAGNKKWPPTIQRKDWLRLGACGALLALHWVTFFQSIQVSTVAIGLLAYATAPVFTAFLEPWWFREPFSFRALIAAAFTMGGIALIAPEWAFSHSITQGLVWGVAAGSSFAVLSLLNRGLRQRYSSAALAFWQDGVAAILLFPVLFWQGFEWTPREFVLLAVLGIVCTALAHGLFIQALAKIPAHSATLVSNLEPVYGILLAIVFLGEVPTGRTIIGGGIVLAVVFWFSATQARSHPKGSLGT